MASRFALYVFLLCHTNGCGQPKPVPVVPAGEVSCPEACAHTVALACGMSNALCLRVCNGIARNDPSYPTCLGTAQSCAALNACGGSDDGGTSTAGPGSGRSGP